MESVSIPVAPLPADDPFDLRRAWRLSGQRCEFRIETPFACGNSVIMVGISGSVGGANPEIRCINALKHDDDGTVIPQGYTVSTPVFIQTEEILQAAAVLFFGAR